MIAAPKMIAVSRFTQKATPQWIEKPIKYSTQMERATFSMNFTKCVTLCLPGRRRFTGNEHVKLDNVSNCRVTFGSTLQDFETAALKYLALPYYTDYLENTFKIC